MICRCGNPYMFALSSQERTSCSKCGSVYLKDPTGEWTLDQSMEARLRTIPTAPAQPLWDETTTTNRFEELITQSDPFWNRIAQQYRLETLQRRFSDLEEARWDDDGGQGSKHETLTYRDQARELIREVGRRTYN